MERDRAGRRTTRRGFIALAGSGTGAALLAACGPGGARQDTSAVNRAPVTLRSWVATPGGETFGATEAADAAIKLKYPHITVVHEVRPPGDYITAVVAAAAAGSVPDVIYAQGTQIQGFAAQGITRPLDNYLARDRDFDLKDFPKVALELYNRDGKQHAIPYDHGPQMLWYNKDLFDQNGVRTPTSNWTMDDMLDAARRLTKAADGRYGMVGFTPESGWVPHGSFLMPWGGKLLNDAETEIFIDTKESIEALEFWHKAVFAHKVNPAPAERNAMQGGANAWFVQGKTAMRDGGPWTFRTWKAQKVPFNFDIADWPRGPKGRFSSSMGSGYPIYAQTRHPDDAWLYVSEYLGKDLDRSLMGQFLKTGFGIPVRLSLMARWEQSKEFAPVSAKLVTAAANYSVVGRAISPIKADLDKIMSEEFGKVWRGEGTMTAAAGEIKRRALPLLEQNKKR